MWKINPYFYIVVCGTNSCIWHATKPGVGIINRNCATFFCSYILHNWAIIIHLTTKNCLLLWFCDVQLNKRDKQFWPEFKYKIYNYRLMHLVTKWMLNLEMLFIMDPYWGFLSKYCIYYTIWSLHVNKLIKNFKVRIFLDYKFHMTKTWPQSRFSLSLFIHL